MTNISPRRAEGLSRSYIQKLLKEGKVMAEGRPVKASFQVEEDIRITLDVPEAVQPDIEAGALWSWIFSTRMRM